MHCEIFEVSAVLSQVPFDVIMFNLSLEIWLHFFQFATNEMIRVSILKLIHLQIANYLFFISLSIHLEYVPKHLESN